MSDGAESVICAARRAAGLTAAEAARVAGMHLDTWVAYEKGTLSLHRVVAQTMSKVLGVSADYLMSGGAGGDALFGVPEVTDDDDEQREQPYALRAHEEAVGKRREEQRQRKHQIEIIKPQRDKVALTQEQAAKRAGWSLELWRRFENGESDLDGFNAEAVSDAIGLDPQHYLYDRRGDLADDGTATSPTHYARLSPQPIEVIESWGLGFHLGNAVKYIARAGHKGDRTEDLKKAVWYLERACKEKE